MAHSAKFLLFQYVALIKVSGIRPISALRNGCNPRLMHTPFPQRILIISEDSHLWHALELMLCERGYILHSEDNHLQAIAAIKKFAPDVLITASSTTVFVYRRNAEILDLPRPVDTENLLQILETREACVV